MKKLEVFECRGTRRGWLGNLMASLAVCLALITPAVADNRGVPGGGPPPPTAPDDETVGTLPALGGTGSLDFLRFLREGRASLYLEGSLDEIQGAIVAVSGHNAVTVELLDDSGDNVRLTFHGRVRILIDRNSMQTGSIGVGVMVPATFGSGQAQFSLGATASAPTGLSPGLLPLPVSSLVARGALDGRALRGLMTSRAAARTSLEITAGRDLVSLTQTH